MTVVGDSRKLQGTIQGNEFHLSGFTGPSPKLIKGTIGEDGSITGTISTGIYKDYVKRFNDNLNALLAEPNPYEQ